MPSKKNSPFATSFKTGVNNGTPCSTVVANIAKRTNKSVNTIWQSLFKAGLCFRQKFNGQWIYWPSFQPTKKATSRNINICQNNLWQCFVEWCYINGYFTPEQLNKKATSQKAFMSFCRSFFGKQFTTSSTTKSRTSKSRTTRTKTTKARRTTTSKSRLHSPKAKSTPKTKSAQKRQVARKTTTSTPWSRTTVTRNYKFPTLKTRRYVKAA